MLRKYLITNLMTMIKSTKTLLRSNPLITFNKHNLIKLYKKKINYVCKKVVTNVVMPIGSVTSICIIYIIIIHPPLELSKR